MNCIIHYSHCVKWTVGQLDRAPYSLYESREATCEASLGRNLDENEDEWIIRYQGKILCNERTRRDAEAIAAYELMNRSRIEAEKHAVWHEVKICNPKICSADQLNNWLST